MFLSGITNSYDINYSYSAKNGEVIDRTQEVSKEEFFGQNSDKSQKKEDPKMQTITREESVTFLSYIIENMAGILSDAAIDSLQQISENIQNERLGYDTWGAAEEELHVLFSETDDPSVQEEKEELIRKYAFSPRQ